MILVQLWCFLTDQPSQKCSQKVSILMPEVIKSFVEENEGENGQKAQSLPRAQFLSMQRNEGHGTQVSALASLWEPALSGLSQPPDGISTLRTVTKSQPAPYTRVCVDRSPGEPQIHAFCTLFTCMISVEHLALWTPEVTFLKNIQPSSLPPSQRLTSPRSLGCPHPGCINPVWKKDP